MLVHDIKDVIVSKDSCLIIQDLATNPLSSQVRLRHIIRGIQRFVNSFRRIDFFHILRGLNDEANKVAKKELTMGKGTLKTL